MGALNHILRVEADIVRAAGQLVSSERTFHNQC
jgi:hypothetical protein